MDIEIDMRYIAFDTLFYKFFTQYLGESIRLLDNGPFVHISSRLYITNVLCYVYANRFTRNTVSIVGVSLLMRGTEFKVDVRYGHGAYNIVGECYDYSEEGDGVRVGRELSSLKSYVKEFLHYMGMCGDTKSDNVIFNFEIDQHVFVSLSAIRYLKIIYHRVIGLEAYY